MVEKFEAGKFYRCRETKIPFYVESVSGDEVTIESSDGKIFTIVPEKIRPGYYHAFTEVPLERIETLISDMESGIDFLKQRKK